MMLSEKVAALLREPLMLKVYFQWILFLGRPKVKLGASAYLSNWTSFSEYWSSRNPISAPELAFIRRAVDEDRELLPVFDVGANLGAFTCFFATLGRRVHSFEPIPETWMRLRANVRDSGVENMCQTNCFAVSDRESIARFIVDDRASAVSRMHSGVRPGLRLIPTVTLDSYCSVVGVDKLGIVKIDVEGMECLVLRGADNLMRRKAVQYLIIEVCQSNLQAAGFSAQQLFLEFAKYDYLAHWLREDGSLGRAIAFDEFSSISFSNVVLAPRG